MEKNKRNVRTKRILIFEKANTQHCFIYVCKALFYYEKKLFDDIHRFVIDSKRRSPV